MVKVILFGCNGHMGLEVQKAIASNEEYKIVCGVDMNPLSTSTFPQVANVQDFKESADVIVDFSSHKAVVSILAYAKEREIPVVLCSTGYTEDEITVIE
ncbi:MAG: 4-hydroxy-tetrahydrodipicolinate reductase, partial [Clostridia bacterium]